MAALAASGHRLPGLPRYDYVATTGDGSGFYAATREFLASWGRLGAARLVVLLAFGLVGIAALALGRRRRTVPRAWLLVGVAFLVSIVLAVVVHEMKPSGAAVVGWPLLWGVPMLPYRALGGPLDADVAFGFGLVLSLAANIVTVFATAYIALCATGRRAAAVTAGALFGLWPLLVGAIGGSRGWGNGTWTVDAGLVMYTEPISTALVAVALALVLSPRLDALRLAGAGVLLSYATTVKLTNALAAFVILTALAARFRRRVLPFVAGLATFVPVAAVFWPKGYAALFDNPNSWPRDPFSLDYGVRNWSESLLFTPRALVILVPPAVIGAAVVARRWTAATLMTVVGVTALFYSFYRVTWEHPRFLFVALPPLFALWAAGAVTVVERIRRGIQTAHPPAAERT